MSVDNTYEPISVCNNYKLIFIDKTIMLINDILVNLLIITLLKVNIITNINILLVLLKL